MKYMKKDGRFWVENVKAKKNSPKYVGVYTRILGMIQDGLYPKGSALPSEPELAKSLGISRMTLRQALALLQEDGIIETKHGKGNFVKNAVTSSVVKEGLEKLGNPLYKCLKCKIDKTETEYRLDVSDSYTKMIFQRETAVFIGVTRRYYSKGEWIAFSFSYLPTDIEELQDVNLEDVEKLEEFLDQKIYGKVHSGHIEVKGFCGSDEFPDEEPLANNEGAIQIVESLVNQVGSVLAYTKYNFPLEQVDFQIHQFE